MVGRAGFKPFRLTLWVEPATSLSWYSFPTESVLKGCFRLTLGSLLDGGPCGI
ncbi:Uncharacterised protein [Providencia heimbachae]|nr:Uncharacterised protein [Providencia heimbachae]